MNFAIALLPETFAICRLTSGAAIPDWVQGEFISITRTQEELSIVCRQENVPDGVRAELDWRCLRIVGQLDFSLVGVIAQITGLLAKADISVFVMSTYDTDYFLVRQFDVDQTVESLKQAGHSVQCPSKQSSP